jgi:hypothetical protein
MLPKVDPREETVFAAFFPTLETVFAAFCPKLLLLFAPDAGPEGAFISIVYH